MANRYRAEVRLGGKWTLKCTFNALCELEVHFGDLSTALAQIGGRRLSLTDLRAVTSILLRDRHPRITEFEAGDIIGQDMQDASSKVADAVEWGVTLLEGGPGKKSPRRATARN